MKSLFGIITTYQSKLTILPVVVIVGAVLTLLIHLLLGKRWTLLKYIPGVLCLLGAVFYFVSSTEQFTTNKGLDLMWTAVVLFVTGSISIAVAWIAALLTPSKKKVKRRPKKKEVPEGRGEDRVDQTRVVTRREEPTRTGSPSDQTRVNRKVDDGTRVHRPRKDATRVVKKGNQDTKRIHRSKGRVSDETKFRYRESDKNRK